MAARQLSLLRTFLLFAAFVTLCRGQNTTASSPVTAGSGSAASAGSCTVGTGNAVSCNFASLPSGQTYRTGDPHAAGGLQGYYNLMSSFVRTIQPGEAYKIINDVLGGVDILNYILTSWQQLAVDYIGWVICGALGIAFLLLLPLVGLIFCCCRCCGNCGGKMQQKEEDRTGCWRSFHSVCLFIVTVFMGTGVALALMSSMQMQPSVTGVGETIKDAFADVPTYINNTKTQLNYIVNQQFDVVYDAIIQDIDDRGTLVGDPVKAGLAVDVDPAIQAVMDMADTINVASVALQVVNNSLTVLQSKATEFTQNLTNIKNALDRFTCDATDNPCTTFNASLDTSGLTAEGDFSSLNIGSELDSVNNVLSVNLTSLALQGKQEFDNISGIVEDTSASAVQGIKTQLDSVKTTVQDIPNQLSVIDTIQNQISGFESMVDDIVGYADQYTVYVGYGAIGLCCLVLLLVLFNLMGLMFGACGSSKSDPPSDRSCMSTSGGNFLMASVGFAFLTGSLLMIIVFVLFLVGGLVERNGCQPLEPPNYDLIAQTLDSTNFLGNMLCQNSTKQVSFADGLKQCGTGSGIYKAFGLDCVLNISEYTNFRTKFPNLNTQLNDITSSVNLSGIVILSEDAKNNLKEFNNSGVSGIDFDTFLNETRKGLAATDLTAFADNLATAAAGFTLQSNKDRMNAIIADLRDMQGLESEVDNVETNINTLKTASTTLQNDISTVLTNAEAAEAKIQTDGPGLVQSSVTAYADRVLGYGDSFGQHVKDVVDNQVGDCGIVKKIYDAMVGNICDWFFNSLNGFWFGLGWCLLFYIPSMIFGVKLAKHYRRMEPDEEEYDGYYDNGAYPGPQSYPMHDMKQGPKASAPPNWHRNGSNRVGPPPERW
ncbi:PROM1 [Branchiostoma lanceolatum]|uniref:PROM1 protein n=1 Tax=Branchiostoma lanceolatum TaxID=7740 RepID=A0A8K0EN11_BRALA|nr:PROM1 [Branchiostoma lanceolatum]